MLFDVVRFGIGLFGMPALYVVLFYFLWTGVTGESEFPHFYINIWTAGAALTAWLIPQILLFGRSVLVAFLAAVLALALWGLSFVPWVLFQIEVQVNEVNMWLLFVFYVFNLLPPSGLWWFWRLSRSEA